MHFSAPIRLLDSRQHGAGCELFIVEGNSASSAVAALRDSSFQAVLPMQGKPLNAIKARAKKVSDYPLYQAIFQSLGIRFSDEVIAPRLPFEKVILLFDPDADGIHIGALMLMFFYQYLRPILEVGCVEMVHPPWMQVTTKGQSPMYAFSESQSVSLVSQLRAQGHEVQTVRYRGLSGIDSATLASTCIEPTTRNTRVVSVADARMAMQVFGGIDSD